MPMSFASGRKVRRVRARAGSEKVKARARSVSVRPMPQILGISTTNPLMTFNPMKLSPLKAEKARKEEKERKGKASRHGGLCLMMFANA